jgi:hypothetical protein
MVYFLELGIFGFLTEQRYYAPEEFFDDNETWTVAPSL